LTAYFDAAQGRQTPIQQDHMWSKLRASVQCLLTIRGALDGKAIPFEAPPQYLGGCGSSFDQQGPRAELWCADARHSMGR
jgi:hypothetical protein